MSADKLDPNTRNNDIGLYWGKTRRVDPLAGGLPYVIGEITSGIKAGTAGDVVWKNSVNGEEGIISLEAGEWVPILCDEILSGATIDGRAETTTATNMIWTAAPSNVGKKK